MDFYHSWVYMYVINTEWFMWTVVYTVLAVNILSPLIAWYVIRGRKLIRTFLLLRKQK
ncbi:hypothetical protein [Paenibacillus cremeus]|uniref:hypothetical protein n=1 Tax=Paenibacillus cremeus TaxID=2163881 RepID=UPI001645FBF2|nr:hypothetical protein [Paenibacillus cremeus]